MINGYHEIHSRHLVSFQKPTQMTVFVTKIIDTELLVVELLLIDEATYSLDEMLFLQGNVTIDHDAESIVINLIQC